MMLEEMDEVFWWRIFDEAFTLMLNENEQSQWNITMKYDNYYIIL